jgi:hypothetical protein
MLTPARANNDGMIKAVAVVQCAAVQVEPWKVYLQSEGNPYRIPGGDTLRGIIPGLFGSQKKEESSR